MSAKTRNNARSLARPRAFDAILYGGLAAGVLDAIAASTNAALRGTSPTRVWQFVASGALGPASYNGGFKTVLLGLGFHFLIAFVAAAIYYQASLIFPILIRQALWCGILYGIAVFFFMRNVVGPLSATRKFPFSLTQLLIGIGIHILFVGLPIALLARRSAKANLLVGY